MGSIVDYGNRAGGAERLDGLYVARVPVDVNSHHGTCLYRR